MFRSFPFGGNELARASDMFKTVAKEAAKRTAKSFLRYMVATFGVPVLYLCLTLALTAAAAVEPSRHA